MFRHVATVFAQGRLTFIDPAAGMGEGYFLDSRGRIGVQSETDDNTVTWYRVDRGQLVVDEIDQLDGQMKALEILALKVSA